MAKNNARITDPNLLIQAGIDPKTGLPIKVAMGGPNYLKEGIHQNLRIRDEETAINRYTWTDLPKGLNASLIERILYYRGQGVLFLLQDKFYFLPYTLQAPKDSTGLDCYGRYTGITPLPFNGTTTANGNEEKPWIQGLVLEPIYERIDPADWEGASPDELMKAITNSCVLLHDYTPQISQMVMCRQILQEPVLDLMSDTLPFMRTALLNSTGIMGMRVGTEGEEAAVQAASNAINKAALEGRKYVGIVGAMDFQELTGGQVARAEEFMMAYQSLENLRLSNYGLDNNGVYQKQAHMLAAEQEMNAGNTGLIFEDGLRNRQEFCLIANSIWGTRMWCVPSESSLGIDRDGDMIAGNDGEAANEMKQEAAAE